MDTELPSISPLELSRLIGSASAPMLLDVRRPETFAASDRSLPGAQHCPPEAVADLARRGPAAGLLAMSLGLSRLYGDDHAMLRAALPLYDALYAWCSDGEPRTHGWREHQSLGVAA